MAFTAPTAPSLRPLVPSGSLIGCQSVHHLPLVGCGQKFQEELMLLPLLFLLHVQFLFPFQRGKLLHNVLIFVFSNPDRIPVCFTIASLMGFLNILPSVLLFPRSNHCPDPWLLIPVMPSSFTRRLFPNVRPFCVLGTALSLPCP
jgi:hypothetical protein